MGIRTLAAFILLVIFVGTGCKGVLSSEQLTSPELQSVPYITIDLGSSINLGWTITGGTKTQALVVSNVSGEDLVDISVTGLAAPFAFAGGSYPGAGGDCGAILAANASCTIVIEYNPPARGIHGDSLDFAFTVKSGTKSQSVPVSAQGSNPATLLYSVDPLDFSSKGIGGSFDLNITVTNTGDLQATSIAISGLAAPFTETNDCGSTLAGGSSSCTITVTFAPTATGSLSDTIEVSFYDGDSSELDNVGVQGTGVNAANLTISGADPFDFGTKATGSTSSTSFTVTNTGTLDATAITPGGLSAPFSVKTHNCSTLAAGGTCSVVVEYSPSTEATHTGTLSVGYSNGIGSVSSTRGLQGTGAAPADLDADITVHDFASTGDVANGVSIDKTITITNSGGVTATSINPGSLNAPLSYKGGTYPGTGGDCGTTLAPAATCTIVVTYAPTVSGTTDAYMTLGFNDGANTQTASVRLKGKSAPPAQLAITADTTTNWGNVIQNTADQYKLFTITNSGGVTATSLQANGTTLQAPFFYADGSFPGASQGGTCGSTLGAGDTCKIAIKFYPTTERGAVGETIEIKYHSGLAANQGALLGISGTAQKPATLSITPNTVEFGTLELGTSTSQTFTVSNSGDVSATTISSTTYAANNQYKYTGGNNYPGAVGGCGTSLGAGSSCNISIDFKPVTSGLDGDTLQLTYNNGITASATASATLSGTGASAASLSFAEAGPYDFGTTVVGGSKIVFRTLRNTGSTTATSISVTGLTSEFRFRNNFAYPGAGGDCAVDGTLAPGATCKIYFDYVPAGSGADSRDITVNYDDGTLTAAQYNYHFDGTGATPASLSFDVTPLAFGTVAVNSTNDVLITIENLGETVASGLSGTGIVAPFTFASGSFPGHAAAGACGATLAGGATCTILLRYNPTIASASDTDTLDIDYNNGLGTVTASLSLSGSAIDPAQLEIQTGTSTTITEIVVGNSIQVELTLENLGAAAASSLAISLSGDATFAMGTGAGVCTASLNGSSTCKIYVDVAPASSGSKTATLTIDYNDGIGSQQFTHSLTATATNPSNLTVTADDSSFDFGSVVHGGTASEMFTITNDSGAHQATSISFASSAPEFVIDADYAGADACGTTLAGGATCKIKVDYSPGVGSSHSSSLQLSYDNGVTAVGPVSNNLTGTGVPPATLTISGTNSFGSVTENTVSGVQNYTVTHTSGTYPATISGISIDSPFRLAAGGTTCTNGSFTGTCNIAVEYAPTATGTHNGNITVNFNDGSGATSETYALSGTATAAIPVASLSISSSDGYNFSTVSIGGNSTFSYTVTHDSGGPSGAITVTSSDGQFTILNNNCGAGLSSGTCSFDVKFAPTEAGASSSTITVGWNGGANTATATLSGASSLPVSGMSPSSIAAGSYGVGSQFNFTIQYANPVNVTGSPRLRLQAGASVVYAGLTSGSGTSQLTFTYTIAGAQNGSLTFGSTSIELNGGTISDTAGNAAGTGFSTFATSLTGVVVDTTAPTITGTGMSDNMTPAKTASWGPWSCSESCTYRFVVNQSGTHSFSSETFDSTNSASDGGSNGNGNYYLHLQAKDTAGNIASIRVARVLDNSGPQFTIGLANPAKDAHPLRSRKVTWTSVSDLSSVSSIEVSLTRDADANGNISDIERGNVIAWKNVGSGTADGSYQFKHMVDSIGQLTLLTTDTYWLSVRMTDSLANAYLLDTAAWDINYFPWNDSGLMYAFDASDPNHFSTASGGTNHIAPTDGAFIGRWYDISGKGKHVEQVTTTARPTYSATGYGGKPTVSFSKVAASVRYLDMIGNPMGTMGPSSVITGFRAKVPQASIVSTDASVLMCGLAGGNGSVKFSVDTPRTNFSFDWDDDNNPSQVYEAGSLSYHTNATIVSLAMSASLLEYAHDGTLAGSMSPVPLEKARTLKVRLGASAAGATLEPDIPIVIGVSRTLTATERMKYEGFIACKTGTQGLLPIAHDYSSANYDCTTDTDF